MERLTGLISILPNNCINEINKNFKYMETTGLRDKNGKEIFIGNKVRFKFYGQHFFTEKVHRTKNGFYPFDKSIRIEVGMCVNPNECTIVP